MQSPQPAAAARQPENVAAPSPSPADAPYVPGDARLRFDAQPPPTYGGVIPPGLAAEESYGALAPPPITIERLPPAPDFRFTFRERARARLWQFGADVLEDHRHFYSLGSLAWLTADLGLGAALANTPADENLREAYQNNVTDRGVRDFVHAFKVFGEGYIWIPVYAGTAVLGTFVERFPSGAAAQEWGERSFRTCLLGAIPLLSLQYVTGASRPGESVYGSNWEPFKDNNGLSGHAFIGAVPFMSAAKMTDSLLLKTILYATSTMTGLSRINDDDHYTSQVVMAWGLAYLCATAVDRTYRSSSDVTIFPLPISDGVGMAVELRR